MNEVTHIPRRGPIAARPRTSLLTASQLQAAKDLLTIRPAVVPGTNCCLRRDHQIAWFNICTYTARAVKVPAKAMSTFWDVAGVPT